MSDALSPFEAINALSFEKRKLSDSQIETLDHFMISMALSMGRATIYYSDYINYTNMSKRMIHDFLINSLPKQKIFNKWVKGSIQDDIVELLQTVYKIDKEEAEGYVVLLDEIDIQYLKDTLFTGGSDIKPKRKGKPKKNAD
jgi:hypothetical protein